MVDEPVGEYFTRLYMRPTTPQTDSRALRTRLVFMAQGHIETRDDAIGFSAFLGRNLGIDVPQGGIVYGLADALRNEQIGKVLAIITAYYKWRAGNAATWETINPHTSKKLMAKAVAWRQEVATMFAEESMGYRLDEKCGVHYYIDEEFERSRVAAVAALDHPKLANPRSELEKAYAFLDASPPDTKHAVLATFACVEALAKLIAPQIPRLNGDAVGRGGQVRVRCLPLLAKDETEKNVYGQMFDSLADWVNACHNYRHAQGTPEPVAPSEELAVHIVSGGAMWARTLARCAIEAPAASGP